jgi:hypothetical protein
MDNLKGDIVNQAYSLLRISGVTSQPSPEELKIGLRRLEGFASELFRQNVCVGYNFEDYPNLNSTSGLAPEFWYPFECNLAVRVAPDFGKGDTLSRTLVLNANQGISFLYSRKVSFDEDIRISYPQTHPAGSGNFLGLGRRYGNFFTSTADTDLSCQTKKIYENDINEYVEHFDSYIKDEEDIQSYTIAADKGLTIVSSSLSDLPEYNVNYVVKADSVGNTSSYLKVKIEIVTNLRSSPLVPYRKLTRFVNFLVNTLEEIV